MCKIDSCKKIYLNFLENFVAQFHFLKLEFHIEFFLFNLKFNMETKLKK